MSYDNKDVTQRILLFAREIGMKDSELALTINIPKQNVGKLRKQLVNIPEAKVLLFLSLHRELNTNWLLFGEGEMLGEQGVYKASFKPDGDVHFEADLTDKNELEEENKRLKTILEEKDKYTLFLENSIEKLNDHISKLIEKV